MTKLTIVTINSVETIYTLPDDNYVIEDTVNNWIIKSLLDNVVATVDKFSTKSIVLEERITND